MRLNPWILKRLAMFHRAGEIFFAISPLTLALVFYGLFRLFGLGSALDQTRWDGADRVAIEAAATVDAAKKVARDAKAAIETSQPTDRTAADQARAAADARVVATQKALDDAKAAAAKLPSSTTSAELAVRLFWGISGVIFTFLLVLVIVQALREIYDVLVYPAPGQDGSMRQTVCVGLPLGLAFVAVIGWVGSVWRMGGNISATAGGMPGQQLLEAASGTGWVFGGPETAGLARVSLLGWLTNFMAAGALVALLLVALAVSFIVEQLHAKLRALGRASTAARPKAKVDADAAWLRDTMAKTATLMQLTAAALIAGVIEAFLLYLMATHHVRETLQPDAHQFAQAIAVSGGVIYSGMLVAIYLPMYDAQKTLGAVLAATAITPTVAVGNANQAGGGGVVAPAPAVSADPLDLAAIPMVKSVLTVLAPVLTAVAAMLVGFLKDVLVTWSSHSH